MLSHSINIYRLNLNLNQNCQNHTQTKNIFSNPKSLTSIKINNISQTYLMQKIYKNHYKINYNNIPIQQKMTEQNQQLLLNLQPEKQYVLQDIMKKRKKDQEAVLNKIKSKLQLKNKKKSKAGLIKPPEKFIKEYRSQQKSYAHYRLQTKKVHTTQQNTLTANANGKLLIVIRIRGVKDIARQQKLILNKLGLRQVNTAVFVKVNKVVLSMLKSVENYITWGEPSKKTVSELIYKKAYGKVNDQRVHIKSNELIEKSIGGDVLCFEDIINEILNVGKHFQQIKEFIYPFKLTTPEGLLVSRLRKPVEKEGHWGYRGEEINEYIEAMI